MGELESDPNQLGGELYEAYMVAKKRWRRFAGRPPRRYRKFHNNGFRQRSNFQRLQKYGKTYAAFLPPNAFAAHRGPGGKSGGKGGGKSRGQNPRGRDGQPLRCHRCGSTEHLIRKCPKPDTGTGNSGMAMLTTVGTSSLQFHAVSHENLQLAAARASSSLVNDRVARGMRDELESLRSVTSSRKPVESITASETTEQVDYSDNPMPKYPPPDTPAPSRQDIQQNQLVNQHPAPNPEEWTTITTGATVASHVGMRTLVANTTDRLLADMMQLQSKRDVESDVQSTTSSQALMRSPDRKSKRVEADKEEQKRARAATTLQLSQLLQQMSTPDPSATARTDVNPPARSSGSDASGTDAPTFPWWEIDSDSSRSHASVPTYHSRTNVDGRIGILIDPGAHDNLAGEETIRLLEMQLGTRAKPRVLDSPLHVSGVGKQSQTADRALTINFGLPPTADGNSGIPWKCSYTAPVIAGSNLPLLLGLKSLMAKRALLDTHGRLLIIPGPGGVEIKCSPGTVALQLEMSESGHLILPLRPEPDMPS